MAINYKDFDFGAIDSGEIATDRYKASAFMRAGTQITLPAAGAVITGVTGVSSKLVAEGGLKPANGTPVKVKVGNNKFASIVVLTKEANDNTRIADAIFTIQPKAHAAAYDLYVAGLVPVPAEISDFAVLNLPGVGKLQEVSSGVEASVDLDDAIARINSGDATALVLTTAMLSYLRRQRVGATGARVFEIVGDNDEGTIDGLPYYVFKSSAPLGFIGDFSRFFYGADSETFNRIAEDGIVVDDDGVEHNLTTQNKAALINEVHQGAGVLSLGDYVTLVPAV